MTSEGTAKSFHDLFFMETKTSSSGIHMSQTTLVSTAAARHAARNVRLTAGDNVTAQR